MKHNVTEIIGISIRALNDIAFPFNKDAGVDYIAYLENHEPISGPLPRTPLPVWLLAAQFNKRAEPHTETEPLFITVSDETGQVLYLQHAAGVIDIGVNGEGAYYRR